ncbi:hypothetical protein ABTE19_22920, partial [Acinetobacter baumannii]
VSHQRAFALFDGRGKRLGGDVLALPNGLASGVPIEVNAPTSWGQAPLRLMVRRLDNGDQFVATQDLRQTQAFAAELM